MLLFNYWIGQQNDTLCCLILLLLICYCSTARSQLNDSEQKSSSIIDELDSAASETNNQLTSESHKIMASGWPSTSSMWPTIDIDNDDDDDDDAGEDTSATTTKDESENKRQWFRKVEPFIYADKPRTGDYSLLLKINSTILDALKGHLKPMSVNLSFEYYFNQDQKSTALPLIKIEVNRKEFKFLDPNGQNVKSRRWMRFNERIQIADLQQLEKHDWLKISLVNRDHPSIVAIRRLRAEFRPHSPDDAKKVDINSSTTTPALNEPNEDKNSKNKQYPPPLEPPKFQPTEEEQTPANDNNNNKNKNNNNINSYNNPTEQPPDVDDSSGDENDISNDQPLRPQQQPQPQPQPEVVIPPQSTPGVDYSDQQNQQSPYAQPQAPYPSTPFLPPNPSGPQNQQTTNLDNTDSDQQDLEQTASEKRSSSTKRPHSSTEPIGSASELLSTTIKPVTPAKKKSGWPTSWIPGKKRRRRDTGSEYTNQLTGTTNNSTLANAATVITLTCQRKEDCDWQSDTKDDGIQWSLARMPTSTSTVQAGYYYNSNRNNYGDSSKLLRIYLNQTDQATIADQNSDHCINLAIYVTERTFLRMYLLTRTTVADYSGDSKDSNNSSSSSSNDEGKYSNWIRGNLLMSWAPTMAINDTSIRRAHLPGAYLAAMEMGQNGWTTETLCFGDFFINPKECGSSRCAFGFMMDTDPSVFDHQAAMGERIQATVDVVVDSISASNDTFSSSSSNTVEQVVGVSILKEYSLNIPIKPSTKSKWFETWQRDEVEPGDNWKFYPRLDYRINANNVSMVNLFHDAHYFIESNWIHMDEHLELAGILMLENESKYNLTILQAEHCPLNDQHPESENIYTLRIKTKLVDSNFNNIHTKETSFDWNLCNIFINGTGQHIDLNMSITDHLKMVSSEKGDSEMEQQSNLFKIVFELVLDLHWLTSSESDYNNNNKGDLSSDIGQYLYPDGGSHFRVSLLNVSLSDRCYPNPCEHGSCQQNGTGLEDWNCKCEDKYRGRRCEYGHWCNVPHIVPWNPAFGPTGNQKNSIPITLKVPTSNNNANHNGRQPKLANSGSERVSGEQYCKSKLGPGYKCTDIDLALNENLYNDEDKTFYCSCKNDYYLSDDSKCRQTHACNSILCPSIGMICDESRPFNQSQPCNCNEKQDWFPDPDNPTGKCIRRQCQDRLHDCGFDAHLCIPTLPGERPICKCGPKFTLKLDDKGKMYCESTACVLPTLNDCQQICLPDSANITRPYSCACHPGFRLDPLDGRSCKPPERTSSGGGTSKPGPYCRPTCPSDSQICTDHGCRCKQGFVGEGEQKVRRYPKGTTTVKGSTNSTASSSSIEYTESIRCLNICSLSYAENKGEFEMIESVCPLGLCDPNTFQCKCSDPTSSSLANEKYEPIYANCSSSNSQVDDDAESIVADSNNDGDDGKSMNGLLRVSPLCHLRRVCETDSSSYKICKSQGAICVPDYTKPAKFDCICPPSTEKRFYGQATASEFTCDSKCSSKKSDCLRKQAVCKQIDRDQVKCDCLPGFMLQDNNVCYLSKFSYSMNLMIINKYYEPEARFHRLIEFNSTTTTTITTNQAGEGGNRRSSYVNSLCPRKKSIESQSTKHPSDDDHDENFSEIKPQFNKIEPRTGHAEALETKMTKSIFIADYNQCNIAQIIPKTVIEDPYEHDIESYLGYIEQCNEKIHQNMRNYHLNSRLSEDIRQSLRQHLREFTVTTNNSSCIEVDSSGMLLNCTIYLQSNEPIDESIVNFVFNDCEKNAHDNKYCWIKPRLLLLKKQTTINEAMATPRGGHLNQTNNNQYNFRQIIPCEINNFCGQEAVSARLDDRTSLCSCRCPNDIEVIDVKDLEPKSKDTDEDQTTKQVAVREICAPRNHCGSNSTHCLLKPGSICHYDIRTGSKCDCVYPSHEDASGKCVEITYSQLNSTLIIIIIMLGTALLISVFLNILVAARAKSMFGRSKQYPMNEFSSPPSRSMNSRSTGVPNPVFEND